MTPEHLRAAGEALHGARWQAPLAADLGVADRTIRRWLAGEQPVPDNVHFEIAALLRAHADALHRMAESSDGWQSPPRFVAACVHLADRFFGMQAAPGVDPDDVVGAGADLIYVARRIADGTGIGHHAGDVAAAILRAHGPLEAIAGASRRRQLEVVEDWAWYCAACRRRDPIGYSSEVQGVMLDLIEIMQAAQAGWHAEIYRRLAAAATTAS